MSAIKGKERKMANEVKVGMRIKMFRDKLKMTLGELSAKSGVSVEVSTLR